MTLYFLICYTFYKINFIFFQNCIFSSKIFLMQIFKIFKCFCFKSLIVKCLFLLVFKNYFVNKILNRNLNFIVFEVIKNKLNTMKKIKCIALMTLFVSTSLFTSCSSDSGSNEDSANPLVDYWPTAVGNQWVLDQNGTKSTMKIIGSEKVNGDTYFKFDQFVSTSNGGDGSAKASIKKVNGEYFIKIDDIVYSANGISGKTTGYEFIFFKDNLEVNKTWTGTYTQQTSFDYPGIPVIKLVVKYTGTILAKGATETIKNVTYKDIIKFKLHQEATVEGETATSTDAEYWIAKDIGVIKFIFNNTNSDLVSYKVN
jgi:hypothetical protein